MLMSLVSVFLISSSVNLVFTRRFNILHAVSGSRLLANSNILTYRLIEFAAVCRDEEDLEVLLHDCHPVFPFVSRTS